jgi:hypothetical protein
MQAFLLAWRGLVCNNAQSTKTAFLAPHSAACTHDAT